MVRGIVGGGWIGIAGVGRIVCGECWQISVLRLSGGQRYSGWTSMTSMGRTG